MGTNTAEKININPLKSVLRSAQKPVTEAKSKTPVIDAGQAAKNIASEIARLKREIDSRETELALKVADLVTVVTPLRVAMCKQEYISSIRMPTVEGSSILLVWSGNYTKIPPGKEDELIQIVGDRYGEYFKSKFVISAEDKTDAELYQLFEWLAPDDTEAGLQEGQKRFASFFSVDEVIRPTERFVRDHVLMPQEVRDRLEQAGIKQYKVSIRNR